MNRFVVTSLLAACCFVATAASVSAAEGVLFSEDFDGLTLGPAVQENGAGDVWTNVPPDGWAIKNTLPDGGMPEWRGWAFPKAEWWPTVDNQERSRFTDPGRDGLGVGIIAVADPDEFDDAGSPLGDNPRYFTWLTTAPIDLSLAGEDSLVLTFANSWRPESTQNAEVYVNFDGGANVMILTMKSVGGGGTQTDYDEPQNKINEQLLEFDLINNMIEIEIDNPGGAREMTITWGMTDGANDWWWAIDQIELITTALNVDAAGKLSTSWGALKSSR